MYVEPIVSSSGLVCLVGGAKLEKTAISAVFPLVDAFIGVDGGADHLLQAGILPAAVVGDLDSLSDQARDAFRDRLCHISEQSTTDFEKALSRVAAPMILALGFTGGRMDHALSVLNVMARLSDRAVILADDHDVCFVPRIGATQFSLPKDTRVAIMPLGPAAVTVRGLQWSFAETVMEPAGYISPSNAARGGIVEINTNGPVLITLPRVHLPTALQAAARAG